ncbi:MAG TPA: zinc-binding dehydrogenase [Solirubrobacter sp.]|nr:zinc-binding dehydrogenase [Solirubrobacter sp.]
MASTIDSPSGGTLTDVIVDNRKLASVRHSPRRWPVWVNITYASPVHALTISEHGGFDVIALRDVPAPVLRRPNDVRIRVRAAALNHLDLFVIEGLPGIDITPPWILGADATGIVEETGADVRTVSRGDRVVINPGISCRTCEYCLDGEQSLCPRFRILGEHLPGTIAEQVVVPAENVRAIPHEVPDDVAAAFTLATLTAWRMVVTRAQVQPGEDVLIWGIGGGVAIAALQICKAIGARVWVTSSSDAKLERARRLGADETVNHREVEVGRVVRERTGKRGMDVVIDNVGQATWKQSLIALGRRGRLVTCGATSGSLVETDVRRMFWNQWTLMGSTMGNDAEFDAIVGELRAGRLHPPVDSVFPIERGREAFERLANGEHFGKVVISLPDRA